MLVAPMQCVHGDMSRAHCAWSPVPRLSHPIIQDRHATVSTWHWRYARRGDTCTQGTSSRCARSVPRWSGGCDDARQNSDESDGARDRRSAGNEPCRYHRRHAPSYDPREHQAQKPSPQQICLLRGAPHEAYRSTGGLYGFRDGHPEAVNSASSAFPPLSVERPMTSACEQAAPRRHSAASRADCRSPDQRARGRLSPRRCRQSPGPAQRS
jgi:hypothetical protein